MTKKIVLRRSARRSILWNFHVVLDSVSEGPAGRAEFAREILRQFGVRWWSRERLVKLACEKMPLDLETATMTDVMKAFEGVLPIEWHNDMTTVDPSAAAEFQDSVLRILAVRTPSQLPKEVTAAILRELQRLLGTVVDESLLPRISGTVENLLVSELWRSKDTAAHKRLASSVIETVQDGGRLDFGGMPQDD